MLSTCCRISRKYLVPSISYLVKTNIGETSTVPPIRRFEELVAWQKARELTRLVYEVTQDGKFARDFGLSSQIQRATVSVMSDIVEGFERGSQAEFYRFLMIAKASCAEVRSQLYIGLDIGYLNQPQFEQLHKKADEVVRVVSALSYSVRDQRDGNRQN